MQKKLSHGDALTVIVHKSMASACRFSYIRSSSRLTTFSRHLAGVMRASSFVTVSAQLLVLIVFLCLCMATGVSASNEYVYSPRTQRSAVEHTRPASCPTLRELLCEPGPPGEIGHPGIPGPRGLDGLPGVNGDPGMRGRPGDIGLPGPSGERGPQGNSGSKGPPGNIGLTGQPGPQGNSGLSGPPGPIGEPGPQGNDGTHGRPGEIGPPGLSGEPGVQGMPGPIGAPGLHGLEGKEGPPGLISGGVVYTRWGRSSCPDGAELLYAGRAGGTQWAKTGGAANYICMPSDPEYSDYRPGIQGFSPVTWIDYETNNGGGSVGLKHELHNQNAPCASCYVSTRGATVMIPAKLTCPSSWTKEYDGYLMASTIFTPHYRTEFVCVDRSFEAIPGSVGDSGYNSGVFYFTEASCYGMPCGPYNEEKELTCVVCSK